MSRFRERSKSSAPRSGAITGWYEREVGVLEVSTPDLDRTLIVCVSVKASSPWTNAETVLLKKRGPHPHCVKVTLPLKRELEPELLRRAKRYDLSTGRDSLDTSDS